MADWSLYGGAGFIGQHLALDILTRNSDNRVRVFDIRSGPDQLCKAPLGPFLESGRLALVHCDVRDWDQVSKDTNASDVMVNLAAVHREPGHREHEYFDTNVVGAENVCRQADKVNCNEIVFTSSISVYGVHNQAVDENTPPVPRTPYGKSKLQAEKVHHDWVARSGGKLFMIRPGVVFGTGEGGNVTRLVLEMLKRDRDIRIKPDQPKAGIYIQELIAIIHWLREHPTESGQSRLVNGVSDQALTFNSYADALRNMKDFSASSLTVPSQILTIARLLVAPLSGILPAGSKIHPERLAKITRPNDIRPTRLREENYPFSWSLERALADWLEKGL